MDQYNCGFLIKVFKALSNAKNAKVFAKGQS